MVIRPFLFLLALAPALAETPRIDQVLNQLERVREFLGVSISPDGKWVAWTVEAPEGNGNTEIYVANSKGNSKPRRVTAGDGKASWHESGVAWSPDSSRIAFFSNVVGLQDEIFSVPLSGGKTRQVTDVKGYVTDIQWSRDGKHLAFLYAEGGGGGGPLEAVPAQTGVIGSEIHNQRITIANASGGGIRQVSPPQLNIYEYDWSPDGNRFAAIAAAGPADNNWWIAQLYTVELNSGKTSVLYHPPVQRQLAVPRWSPDGKQIGFIGGLMSDAGFNGGDLFVVSSSGGQPRDITAERKSTPNWLAWHGNAEIVFTENVDGGSAISSLNLASGSTEMLWKGPQQIHDAGNYANFSLADDGRTSALVRTSWEQPPEIWAGPAGNWQQITHENSAQRPHWGKAESIVWDNDNFRVQGWLLYPEDFNPAKRYPMVVSIHGGPANLRTASWPSAHFDMSVMAALGYFVFFPNPRGSYGEGEAFTRANVKDFGSGDLRDVLAGVDAVLKRVPVDTSRVGVTGWSYGGFMTMWTVTQTHRFRAAVAGAGIADWLSYYGENSIDEWMIPYFGASVYDDPAAYAKSSPITFIKQVKTPTLIVVGEHDGECPAPQSFEFWHALKTLGVHTELVVYPGEGHAFRNPTNRLDVVRRTAEWFDRYLKTG